MQSNLVCLCGGHIETEYPPLCIACDAPLCIPCAVQATDGLELCAACRPAQSARDPKRDVCDNCKSIEYAELRECCRNNCFRGNPTYVWLEGARKPRALLYCEACLYAHRPCHVCSVRGCTQLEQASCAACRMVVCGAHLLEHYDKCKSYYICDSSVGGCGRVSLYKNADARLRCTACDRTQCRYCPEDTWRAPAPFGCFTRFCRGARCGGTEGRAGTALVLHQARGECVAAIRCLKHMREVYAKLPEVDPEYSLNTCGAYDGYDGRGRCDRIACRLCVPFYTPKLPLKPAVCVNHASLCLSRSCCPCCHERYPLFIVDGKRPGRLMLYRMFRKPNYVEVCGECVERVGALVQCLLVQGWRVPRWRLPKDLVERIIYYTTR